MYDVLDLCVGCKGCRRECPTGVDMARMKIEFLYHYRKKHGWRTKDRIVANLPRYAPMMKYANAPTRLRNALGAARARNGKAERIFRQSVRSRYRPRVHF